MGEQIKNEQDIEIASKVMRSNFEGPASIFAIFANITPCQMRQNTQ